MGAPTRDIRMAEWTWDDVWNFVPIAELLAGEIGGAVGNKNGLQIRDRERDGNLSGQIDFRVKKDLDAPPGEASMKCDFAGPVEVSEDSQSATFYCSTKRIQAMDNVNPAFQTEEEGDCLFELQIKRGFDGGGNKTKRTVLVSGTFGKLGFNEESMSEFSFEDIECPYLCSS